MAYWVFLSEQIGQVLVQDADEEKQVRADYAANEKKRLAAEKGEKPDSSK